MDTTTNKIEDAIFRSLILTTIVDRSVRWSFDNLSAKLT